MRRFLALLVSSSFLLGGAATPAADESASWVLGPFLRPPDAKPVLAPDPKSVFDDPIRNTPVRWEALHTFNPAAIIGSEKIEVLYRAEDNTGGAGIGEHTSRLGLAESTDGIHFTKMPEPVFYPSRDSQMEREWPGGTEDPRIVQSLDGLYVLTYTQWNRKIYRIGIATSRDLIHWTKYGPAFAEAGEKYQNFMYKSGGIVTELEGGEVVAAKIHGKYWMYWGEIQVRLATSDDLIHWTPVEDARGNTVVVLAARPGHFDSGFPEVGPPPLLTSKGVVVIYNAKNASVNGDPSIKPGAYSDGQALFSADDPAKVLARTDKPFFKPERPFEMTGQYSAGTTFAEGLVFYRGKWLLYYGCADSMVGVALADTTNSSSGN
jgi:beta-1,2-mannosidase